MVTEVRPLIRRSSARPIRISSAGSTALVASSSTSRSGSARWARISATSCRSPADSDSPRWPTRVSRPRGSPSSQSARPSSRQRLADLVVGRVEPAVARVGAQRGVEQEALLRHHHHPVAQRGERHRAQVDPVEPHRPRGRVHQPGQQLGQGGLARAGLPDDGDPACRARSRRSRRAAPAGRRGRRTPTSSNSIETGALRQRRAGRRRGRRRRPGSPGSRSPGASRRSRSGRR